MVTCGVTKNCALSSDHILVIVTIVLVTNILE